MLQDKLQGLKTTAAANKWKIAPYALAVILGLILIGNLMGWVKGCSAGSAKPSFKNMIQYKPGRYKGTTDRLDFINKCVPQEVKDRCDELWLQHKSTGSAK